MTVMPSAPPVAAPAASSAGTLDPSGGAGAAGFAEMLLAALPTGGQPGGQSAPQAGAETDPQLGTVVDPTLAHDPATPLAEEVPAEETDQAGTVDQAALPLLATLPFAVVQAVRQAAPDTPAAAAAGTGTASVEGVEGAVTPAATSTVGTGNGTGNGAGSGTGAETGGQGAPGQAMPQTAATTATTAITDDAVAPAGTATAAGAETHPAVEVRETAAPDVPTTAPVARPAGGASPAAGGIDVSAMTPVSGTAGVTGPAQPQATTQPAAPAAPAPVAQQVFGEVSRLVTRGDGTHRLTMTLSPEALGDVRVTLTVRGGEVHVQFAAGDDAQRALLESTPELRRLLELTGATESRITVRDALATSGSSGTGSSTTGSQTGGQNPDRGSAEGTDPGTAGGQDPTGTRRDPQDHHARTREGQNAMDGDHRGVGASRRPHDPATSTRPAGLDVTV